MVLIALYIGAYLLGSIPFGHIVAKAKGVDIMKAGSGNIGATNVIRVLGKGPGLLVFALDLLKGIIPCVIARFLFPERQELWFYAGGCAVVGHTLSPFLKFKGGKGIATALGMCFASTPIVAIVSTVIFITSVATTRFVSVGSILGVIATIPVSLLVHDSPWVTVGLCLLAIFAIYKHKANIARLRAGTESKFSFNKSKPPPEDKDAS